MATLSGEPGQSDRTLDKGHGTRALGPSNSSDTGSDVAGGNAGAHLGDTDLSGDSDAEGTGERATAGRDDTQPAGKDIAPDRETSASDPSLGLTVGPQGADGSTPDRAGDVERGSGPARNAD
jgi:hypothetical protein